MSAIRELATKIFGPLRALDELAARASIENARQAADAMAAARRLDSVPTDRGEIGERHPSPGPLSDPSPEVSAARRTG
ncbi:MAG: hypothetical protein ACRDI3_05605 [Actinomycetota bacterium]